MTTNKLISSFISTGTRLVILAAMLMAAFISSVTPALAATVSFDLYAVSGTTTLGVQTVTVWGYNSTGATATQPGGPVLIVNQGDTVQVTLHNQLTESTALLFQGQAMVPDTNGAAPGGTTSYTFTATNPGTFLYEAGLLPNAEHQTAMGLYGALVVRPVTAGQAYDSAATAFNDEGVLVLSEIDPALNNSATPSTFDMRNYAPRYFLINGKAYPNTDPILSAAGSKVLLRYVNAGIQQHSMGVLGLRQNFVAKDGSLLPTLTHNVAAESLAPGQTGDAIVTIPAAATTASKFAVYDGSLMLRNSNTAGFGGMLTFVTTGPTVIVPPILPTTSGVALSPNTTNGSAAVILSASIDSATSTITAAEYFIDTVGANGSGIAMAGSFGSATVAVNATISTAQLSALASGNHTIYVHGTDGINWSAVASAVLKLDKAGPATSGLTLTPNPSNGLVSVALSATGNDSGTGGANVTAAEYTIDSGSAVPMTLGGAAAPVRSLSATIPAGLLSGSHTVAVRSQDALGNWGAFATITLNVVASPPVTSNVSAAKNPNNGTLPLNASQPVVRVTATMTSTGSTVSAAEGFIDTSPAITVRGFPFVPSDGAFNSATETGYGDIPLTTINALSTGNHTIYVRGKDAVGNWGPTSSTILVIDRTPPTIVSINRVDSNPAPNGSVNFLVTFSESVNGVAASNFTIVRTGLSGTSTITSVTGTGVTRTVTATTGTGTGTIGLNLTSPTGISDLAGNAMTSTGLPFVGQVYNIVPPPQPSLYFSTSGNTNPSGVGGTADDADIYFYNNPTFSRNIDVTALANPLPTGANVDGFDRVSATQFYMSFDGNVTVPGIAGTVADEDIVFFDGTVWSLYFDGSVNGLTGGSATDIDAISIVGAGGPGNIYFSTDNTAVPPGAGGTGDDADIYRWNGGSSYTRMVDASVVGWSTADVDGLVWVDATHVYLSYSADTTVPGTGAVQDEDVVRNNGGTWSVYFDGTAVGLGTSGNLDIDAFDLP